MFISFKIIFDSLFDTEDSINLKPMLYKDFSLRLL